MVRELLGKWRRGPNPRRKYRPWIRNQTGPAYQQICKRNRCVARGGGHRAFFWFANSFSQKFKSTTLHSFHLAYDEKETVKLFRYLAKLVWESGRSSCFFRGAWPMICAPITPKWWTKSSWVRYLYIIKRLSRNINTLKGGVSIYIFHYIFYFFGPYIEKFTIQFFDILLYT